MEYLEDICKEHAISYLDTYAAWKCSLPIHQKSYQNNFVRTCQDIFQEPMYKKIFIYQLLDMFCEGMVAAEEYYDAKMTLQAMQIFYRNLLLPEIDAKNNRDFLNPIYAMLKIKIMDE